MLAKVFTSVDLHGTSLFLFLSLLLSVLISLTYLSLTTFEQSITFTFTET
jgi:hypothetical protein